MEVVGQQKSHLRDCISQYLWGFHLP